ncbi:hypothetical protein AB5I41_14945 [Sphingomonas sp. MMS24-JH45]
MKGFSDGHRINDRSGKEGGLSYPTLIKLILVAYIGIVPTMWYLHTYHGVSQPGASGLIVTVIHIACFSLVLLGPWLKPAGQRHLRR